MTGGAAAAECARRCVRRGRGRLPDPDEGRRRPARSVAARRGVDPAADARRAVRPARTAAPGRRKRRDGRTGRLRDRDRTGRVRRGRRRVAVLGGAVPGVVPGSVLRHRHRVLQLVRPDTGCGRCIGADRARSIARPTSSCTSISTSSSSSRPSSGRPATSPRSTSSPTSTDTTSRTSRASPIGPTPLSSSIRTSANEFSVALELQADCFAGAWASSVAERGTVRSRGRDRRGARRGRGGRR